jgi:hypothetical protein
MAKCFLAVPATSAPLERIFSRSKTIICSQRHSLSSLSIEHLLCIKEWYQKFDLMMDSSTIDKANKPHEDEDDDETAEENSMDIS